GPRGGARAPAREAAPAGRVPADHRGGRLPDRGPRRGHRAADTAGSMKLRIAPSILAADFARLAEAVAAAEAGGADLVHVDVMDGDFVANLTIGAPVVSALSEVPTVHPRVHLIIMR